MQDMCCGEKRPKQKLGVGRRRQSAGSFKATNSFSNSEMVMGKNSPRPTKTDTKGHDSLEKTPKRSNSEPDMDIESGSTIPKSGSWRGSGSSFRSSGKGETVFQNSCDWSLADQRSLEYAIESAAQHMKQKPPGFFAIQVKSVAEATTLLLIYSNLYHLDSPSLS
jgi:hypothetical protein